jgi:hypothetical protein
MRPETSPNDEHARSARAIDAHFGGRASRVETRLMRAHLPGCAVCKRRYERSLLLAKLDPCALSSEERLGAGLGFRRAARPLARRGLVTFAVAALALAVWWPNASWRARSVIPQPAARGAHAPPSLFVYRVGPDGAPALAGGLIHDGDELAFAYSNPRGLHYLLVYATDEHGHVYWFHPAWPVGATPPLAVEARPGAGPHELPEAVRHRFDGRRLEVTAVFSDDRLGVGAIERDGRALPFPPEALAPRVEVTTRTLEVSP